MAVTEAALLTCSYRMRVMIFPFRSPNGAISTRPENDDFCLPSSGLSSTLCWLSLPLPVNCVHPILARKLLAQKPVFLMARGYVYFPSSVGTRRKKTAATTRQSLKASPSGSRVTRHVRALVHVMEGWC